MRVRKREIYWLLQTFEIGKKADIGEFINRGLSLLSTVMAKLLLSAKVICTAG